MNEILGYTTPGIAFCVKCFKQDEHDGDEVGAVTPDQEWDSEPTCDICGRAIKGVQVIGGLI